MSNNKMIVGGVIALLAVAGLSYYVFGVGKSTKPAEVAVVVPSVATVNGVEIPKSVFDSQLASAITTFKGQGVDVENAEKLAQIKAQVLNDLIGAEVVNQEVLKSGIKATPEQIEEQYKTIVTQLGGADKLLAQLTAANLTDTQLRENIAKQFAIQAYLAQNVATNTIVVTDKEISDFYTEYKKTQKDAPALKELSDQIKQQLTTNKQQVLLNEFVNTLRAKATVTASTDL